MTKKLFDKLEAAEQVQRWRNDNKKVVFTNGCFDILHAGHVRYLAAARQLGDRLVVGLNTDASVRRLKGPKRPVAPEQDRAEVLSALASVDAVTLFDDDTPETLIKLLLPDILVKGADWPVEKIAGAKAVIEHGGSVLTMPLLEGRSTTGIIETIIQLHCPQQTGG
ncbi:MAG: D-glycero-beta-D-manno-heptose 1-phosphate adenylyltransferase [Chlorobaculum sp.]